MIGDGCPKCCGEGKIHAICLSPENYKIRFGEINLASPGFKVVDCDNCDGKGLINIRPLLEIEKPL